MRFKHFLLVVPLLAAVLVGCSSEDPIPIDPDPTPTEPEEPEELVAPDLTAEDVEEILEKFSASSVNGYTYWYRYKNGTRYDEGEVIDFKVYDEGFDSDITIYYDFPTTSSVTGNTAMPGRYASYILDDDWYIRGLQGVSSSVDYYQYNERNMYIDHYDGLTALKTLQTDVTNGFLYQEDLWSSDYDFVISDIETSINDDGNVEITVGAELAEDPIWWSGYETAEVVLEVDPEDYTVKAMMLTIVVHEYGQPVGTIDESAARYERYRVDNISYGEIYTDEITPFDPSSFSADRIFNAPSEVVEGIGEGDISVSTAQQIIDNYDAYMEGMTSSTEESNLLEFYHPGYTNEWGGSTDVGETLLTVTNNLYANYVFETTSTYTPDNTAYTQYTSTIKYEALEEGVLITTSSSSESELVPGEEVTSMDTYFSPNPFDITIYEAFNCFVDYGVGNNGAAHGSEFYQEISGFEASKSGDTITIQFTYHVCWHLDFGTGEPYILYDNTYDYKVTVVNDFMTEVTKDEQSDGTYSHYTMSKGVLTAYPSE